MKRLLIIILSITAVLSCQRIDCQKLDVKGKTIFYSQLESFSAGTKTFIDPNNHVLWSSDDRISLFSSTYNQEYRFCGETGDNNGAFERVSKEGEFVTGEEISTNYAIFPYSPNNKINSDGRIDFVYPDHQNHAPNSFGPKDNIMVAVTKDIDDNLLLFKNLCGYLTISVYGDGQVKTISLVGNNGEMIAGPAYTTPIYGEDPAVQMGEAASSTISIDCSGGVVLDSTEENCTQFWFCLPPTVFSKGITISISDYEGNKYEKQATSQIEIKRNSVSHMSPFKVSGLKTSSSIHFEDQNFESYCLDNFDTDKDEEISIAEALQITKIDYSTNSATISLRPLAQFVNLEKLSIKYISDGGQNYNCLFDISNNKKLTELKLENIGLNYFNFSKNNELSRIDVNNCSFYVIILGKNQIIPYCNGVSCSSQEDLRCQLRASYIYYESGNSGSIESLSWGNEID